jgi:hypothetical protein
MPNLHPVTVKVSDAGAIKCTEKGGHVRGARSDQIEWVGRNVEFTLIFEYFPSGAHAWPFTIPEPPSAFWPRANFTGTLKDEGIPKYYKYTVRVAGYEDLDPIVIVDK